MILIDTSVWVEFFRKKGSLQAKHRVASLLNDDAAAYTCPVLLELSVGARETAEVELISETMGLCQRVIFLPEFWERAATLERTLRQRGATVPRDDILVATVAVECQLTLLCRDAHFDLIGRQGGCALKVEQVQG
jgi:predicted nucleic acid-binding protein